MAPVGMKSTQNFVAKGIPALGVEPAANVAATARAKGVPTEVVLFGEAAARDLAGRGKQADLIVGNNVLAQVPDLNDFVKGMKVLLKPSGVAYDLAEGEHWRVLYSSCIQPEKSYNVLNS